MPAPAPAPAPAPELCLQVFSAGHNLKEMTIETGYEYHKKIFDTCEEMMTLVGKVSSKYYCYRI